MTASVFNSWRTVQQEVLRRIKDRTWKPGDLIPNEAELALEFGCARATVNRALRALAETGLLDRKRKAGTRVAMHPVRKATLDIPIIRDEIDNRGRSYCYSLLSENRAAPPPDIRARMQIKPGAVLMHLVSLHLADGRPYVFEDRWLNPKAVPEVERIDFTTQSPNEWLVVNVPFEGGDIAFSAMAAGVREAEILSCRQGEGLFVIDRSTWTKQATITSVRLTFAPGYRMHTEI